MIYHLKFSLENTLIKPGMNYVRRNFHKRGKNKSPFVHVRMGDNQIIVFDDCIIIEENVEVYNPRPPLHSPCTSHLIFYFQAAGEEFMWREGSHYLYNASQEPILADITNWL